MRIHVDNLSPEVTEDNLRSAFEPHGQVSSAQVLTDRDTGRSRGLGFVEMTKKSEAHAAIRALNGSMLGGRTLIVNEAKSRSEGQRRRGGYSANRRR